MKDLEILLSALDIDHDDKRREYLEDVCGDDVALRSRVESLLQSSIALGNFLESPATDKLPRRLFSLSKLEALGDYRLVHEIGRGAMGVVYEAEQVSVGRRVALKFLPFAALLNQTQLERFETEATAAARLQHSGIVQIYSVGCERGIHFYSMQLIDGPSLDNVIAEMRQKRHPDGDQDSSDTVVARDVLTRDDDGGHYRAVARIGKEAATALQYAHEHGVLHRDIKPSNLLLDKSGHVWIADFGLARVEDESQLTRTGDILGTLRYMSPEQAKGDRLDSRTDIYSLGATLYELVTLQPAYDSEDRRDIIKQVVAGNPVAPHKVDDRIPHALSLVISKAMARLDERYQSAKELADDLQRFLDGEPVHARTPSPLRRVNTTLLQHPIITISLTALLIVACLYIPHRLGTSETDNTSVTSSTDTRDPTMFRSASKKRTSGKNERIRQLRHEQLEDRRLLTGTASISGTVFDDVNANGVQDTGEMGIPDSTVSAALSTPWLTIHNPTPETGEHFGRTFAVVGDQIVIGDPVDDSHTGRAWVFDAKTGDEITQIDNPSPDTGDVFSFNMCEADGKVVIGAGWDDTDGERTGIAYLYDLSSYDGSPLVPEREFHHPTPTGDEWFGWEMRSLPGKVLIAGNRDDLVAIESGAVYMFDTNGGEPQIIENPSPAEHDKFGETIASQENRFFVHAFGNSIAPGIGVVYMYSDQGELLRTFNNPIPEGDPFGIRILASDNYVIISAWENSLESRSGLVHLYEIDTGELVRTFASPNPSIGDYFGSSLAFVGDLVAIGAQADDTFAENGGAVYLFDMATGQLVHTLRDPTPYPDALFGGTMIAADGTLWVAAYASNQVPDNPHPGVVYAFQVPETATTNAQGGYSFTGLYADDYDISHIVPDGYVQTAPSDNGTHTVTLADGETLPGIDFGNLAYETHVSNDTFPLSLQDAKNAARPGVTTSTIDVSGLNNVLDLNVTIDISHSHVGQLSARLIAPDGTPVELFNNVGGDGDNFTATEFDDEAAVPITSGTAPFTGTFRPVGSLAVLDNIIATGEWKLEISDNAKGDTGTLNSWALNIAAIPAGNTPPVAEDDTYSTNVDEMLTVAALGVLDNDRDDDGDEITAALVGNGTTTEGGTVTLNVDGSFTYTPNTGFVGNDSFSYTVSDGNGGTDTGTVTVNVSDPSASTAIYVYDIRFEPQRPGTYRAVFEIHADNGDGIPGNDSGVAGINITVEFAGQIFTGTTDENGMFVTGWVRKLSAQTEYAANVLAFDLAMTDYEWDPLMDYLAYQDEDHDGRPDNILWFE